MAEGEMMVTRWTARAALTGITIAHIAADKIVEQWTNFDNLGLVQQLGVVPLPG